MIDINQLSSIDIYCIKVDKRRRATNLETLLMEVGFTQDYVLDDYTKVLSNNRMLSVSTTYNTVKIYDFNTSPITEIFLINLKNEKDVRMLKRIV